MEKKFKLTVVFGKRAAEYAFEHGIEGAIRKIKNGSLDGEYKVYKLDTKEDVEVVKQALQDSNGWEDVVWGV